MSNGLRYRRQRRRPCRLCSLACIAPNPSAGLHNSTSCQIVSEHSVALRFVSFRLISHLLLSIVLPFPCFTECTSLSPAPASGRCRATATTLLSRRLWPLLPWRFLCSPGRGCLYLVGSVGCKSTSTPKAFVAGSRQREKSARGERAGAAAVEAQEEEEEEEEEKPASPASAAAAQPKRLETHGLLFTTGRAHRRCPPDDDTINPYLLLLLLLAASHPAPVLHQLGRELLLQRIYPFRLRFHGALLLLDAREPRLKLLDVLQQSALTESGRSSSSSVMMVIELDKTRERERERE